MLEDVLEELKKKSGETATKDALAKVREYYLIALTLPNFLKKA